MQWPVTVHRSCIPFVIVALFLFFSGTAGAEHNERPSENPIHTYSENPTHTSFDWIGYGSIEFGRQTGTSSAPTAADLLFSNGYYAQFDLVTYGRGLFAGSYEWTVAYDHSKSRSSEGSDESPIVYPIFGDASQREYDALSRDALYLSIQRGRSRLLYGDYRTGNWSQLVPFDRMLTGPRFDAVFSLGQAGEQELGLTLMAARTKQTPYIELIPAQGIAGFYRLTHGRIGPRSEKVELVTYDPTNRDEPININLLRRDIDYTIDYVDGSLLFTQPIPVQDVLGNLNFIRVQYDYDSAGLEGAHATRAARGTYAINGLQLGTSWIDESGGNRARNVVGADVNVRLSDQLHLISEIARSRSTDDATDLEGYAYLMEIIGRPAERVDVRLFHRNVEPSFETYVPETMPTGTSRTGVEVDVRASDVWKTQVRWETERRLQPETGLEQQREMASLGASYRRQSWTLSGRVQSGTLQRIDPQVERFKTRGASVALDYMLPAGGSWSLSRDHTWSTSIDSGEKTQKGSTGIRYQSKMSDTTAWAFGYTLTDAGRHGAWIGFDRQIYDTEMLTTTLYSRYRLDGVSELWHGQASAGMSNRWQVTSDLSADVHFELIADPGEALPEADIEMPRPQAQNAFSITLSYLPDAPYSISAHHSRRSTESGLQRYTEVASLGRLSSDLSLLVKGAWTESPSNDVATVRHTQSVSFAFRPIEFDRLNALLHYERGIRYGSIPEERMNEHTASAESSYWVTSKIELGLKFAQRHRLERVPPVTEVHSITDLYQARTSVELLPRLDFNAVYRRLYQKNTDLWQVGYQTSFAFKMAEHDPRWLVEVGHRYADYAPEDDPSDDAFTVGPFVRFTYLF